MVMCTATSTVCSFDFTAVVSCASVCMCLQRIRHRSQMASTSIIFCLLLRSLTNDAHVVAAYTLAAVLSIMYTVYGYRDVEDMLAICCIGYRTGRHLPETSKHTT